MPNAYRLATLNQSSIAPRLPISRKANESAELYRHNHPEIE